MTQESRPEIRVENIPTDEQPRVFNGYVIGTAFEQVSRDSIPINRFRMFVMTDEGFKKRSVVHLGELEASVLDRIKTGEAIIVVGTQYRHKRKSPGKKLSTQTRISADEIIFP